VRMARENSGWGYDRIVDAMAHLGHTLSDQTVGNILQRHSILPAPAPRLNYRLWKLVTAPFNLWRVPDWRRIGALLGRHWNIIRHVNVETLCLIGRPTGRGDFNDSGIIKG
jgi:hypothetical protein